MVNHVNEMVRPTLFLLTLINIILIVAKLLHFALLMILLLQAAQQLRGAAFLPLLGRLYGGFDLAWLLAGGALGSGVVAGVEDLVDSLIRNYRWLV